MSTADDLKTARDIVAQRWHKGGLTDGQGNVCAVGAVKLVCFGGVHNAHLADDSQWGRYADALYALDSHLPGDFAFVPAFNDAESTTHADVLNLFDKTLADLGGMG